MTIEDSLKPRLAVSLAKHGENGFSVRMLRQQLSSIARFRREMAKTVFELGRDARPTCRVRSTVAAPEAAPVSVELRSTSR
jgi:hypothetical protein